MAAANSQASESASVAAATALRLLDPGWATATTSGLVAAAGGDAGNEHPNEQTAQNHSHLGYTYIAGRGFMGRLMGRGWRKAKRGRSDTQ